MVNRGTVRERGTVSEKGKMNKRGTVSDRGAVSDRGTVSDRATMSDRHCLRAVNRKPMCKQNHSETDHFTASIITHGHTCL